MSRGGLFRRRTSRAAPLLIELAYGHDGEPIALFTATSTTAEQQRRAKEWLDAWSARQITRAVEAPIADTNAELHAMIDERLGDPGNLEVLTTALMRRAARARLTSTGS